MTETYKCHIPFDNSFARELKNCSTSFKPAAVPKPELAFFNHQLADELRIDRNGCDDASLAQYFSGNREFEGAHYLAQIYAGHQFGHYSPQLGDGRALLIGEVCDRSNIRYDLAFKGSGPTPYARTGDGKAVLGPMLREVLLGEAMNALGIPSTRALALVFTGESVFRKEIEPGAVLTRVALSHLRIGTFEYFANQDNLETLCLLARYTIARHDPELLEVEYPYLKFFAAVTRRLADLMVEWMSIGFIHGVMNTDNMAISGQTIDYGPCAFMEGYDPSAVFSSIDRWGRYAYIKQPQIARWNLERFADALDPLLDHKDFTANALPARDQKDHIFQTSQKKRKERVEEILVEFDHRFASGWVTRMRSKIGFSNHAKEYQKQDKELIHEWLTLLYRQKMDYTLAWRYLSDAAVGNDSPLFALASDRTSVEDFLTKWRDRLRIEHQDEQMEHRIKENAQIQCKKSMDAINPWIIPRNHHVEAVLAAATCGDIDPALNLIEALKNPFTEKPEYEEFVTPAPIEYTRGYQTYCGT